MTASAAVSDDAGAQDPGLMQDNAPTTENALIAVRRLGIAFPAGRGWARVVNGVSFDVKPGETVGVVGESGCGKSLTALSILGLLPRRGCRRTGQILFDGSDLVRFGESDMRRVRGRKIGMIFQEPMSALDPVFTVGASDRRDGARTFQGLKS